MEFTINDKIFIHDIYGWVHVITSLLAVYYGTRVIFLPNKGNKKHKVNGYIYVILMLIMIIPTIKITYFFNKIGWFHLFSVYELILLYLGMRFIWNKNIPLENHFRYMYFSLIGLYSALFIEFTIRVPNLSYLEMQIYTAIITIFIFLIGFLFYGYAYKRWISKTFNV